MKAERKRRALGKGLGSLIPDAPSDSASREETSSSPASQGEPLEIPIDAITPNPHQPRRTFDEDDLAELADSIRASGILQPLLVRPEPAGGYTLIAGERRLRAATLAGLEVVPAVVRRLPDARLLEVALIENIQRDDLGPLETARAFRTLVREFGLTQAEIASRVGKPRSTVANFLRLLDLPASIQEMLDTGALDMGHGRTLAGVDREADQLRLARRAVDEKWSVRQLEESARRMREKPEPKPRALDDSSQRDPNVVAAETTLSRALGAKVSIHVTRRGRGHLEIRFANDDELDRLYRALLRAGGGAEGSGS